MVAKTYIEQGENLSRVLELCGLSKSSFYYKSRSGKRGRKASSSTVSTGGISYSNEFIVERMEFLLQQEFVDYGYEKVTSWLRDEGFIINEKKTYRLMKEHRLLSQRIRRNKGGKRIAASLIPNATEPFEHLQMDIKYIYIHGCHRNVLLITVLDVFSRGVLGYRLQWSITKTDVVLLMQEILQHYRMPLKVTLRTDNGSIVF